MYMFVYIINTYKMYIFVYIIQLFIVGSLPSITNCKSTLQQLDLSFNSFFGINIFFYYFFYLLQYDQQIF